MTDRDLIYKLQRQLAYNHFHPTKPIDTKKLIDEAWQRGYCLNQIWKIDKPIEHMISWEILFCLKDVIDQSLYSK